MGDQKRRAHSMTSNDSIRIPVQILSQNMKNNKNSLEKYRYHLRSNLPDRTYNFTKESRIKFYGIFGMKKNKDLDNSMKILFDELQRKYKFDDRQIHEIHVFKQPVVKYSRNNAEFIEFTLSRI